MFRQCPLRVGSVSFPSTDRVHRLTSHLELFVEPKLKLLEFFDALVHIVLRRANYVVGNSSVGSAQVRGHLVLSVRGWVADPPRGLIFRSYRMHGIIFRLCVWMRAFLRGLFVHQPAAGLSSMVFVARVVGHRSLFAVA